MEAELAPDEGRLDGDAIAVDFVAARRAVEGIAKRLDYTCINEVSPFDEINPSAENIAHWFHEQLGDFLEAEKAVVREIVLWEGPVNSVRYRPS